MQYYDCPECKNKGYIYYLDSDGYEVAKDCECRKIRCAIQLIKQSGLENELKKHTFENFEDKQDYQKYIKNKATKFIGNDNYQAFFIGGQPGAGKTHICTAIVGEMLRRCIPTVYMSWCQDSKKLKANINDSKAYDTLVNRFKTIAVLYIDDFFKTGKKESPSSADISLAFEIINYRYQRRELKTIISSEYNIGNITEIDEALGSRISAMAKEFCLNIAPDKSKNFRIKQRTESSNE